MFVMATYSTETKVWSNPPSMPLYNPNGNLGQIMLTSLNAAAERVVQIEAATGTEITAQEIRIKTIRAANNFRDLGINEGDVVAIATQIRNCIPPVFFACLAIGAPINTMDPDFQIEDYLSMMRQTKPKIILCESRNIDIIRRALKKLNHEAKMYTVDVQIKSVNFVDELFNENGDDMNFVSEEIKDPDSYIALIVCSSGTTGTSKGIAVTHKSLIKVTNTSLKLAHNEIFLITGSLYWISNCSFLIGSTVIGVKRIINSDPFNAEKTLQYIEKYKVNLLPMSPNRLYSVLRLPFSIIKKYDLSHVKLVGCYGTMFTETLKKKVEEILPGVIAITAYGASEVISNVTRIIVNYAPPCAVGHVEPGCELKIIDDEGNAVDNGKQGQILIRRDERMIGYYNDPISTRKVLDKDGWLQTGDVGYFDDTGCLFIVDRIKDLISYKGFWVVPGPLEDAIAQIEGVKEVVAVGIPHETDDELPAAVVVKSDGSKVTERDIKKVIADNFNDINQLRGGVYFVDRLPETPSGKFQRKQARNIAIEMYNAMHKGIRPSKL